MSISSKTPFTYDRLTWKDYVSLIGSTPSKYCQVVQPKQCKAFSIDLTLQDRCQKVFDQCVEEADRFERWHRLN